MSETVYGLPKEQWEKIKDDLDKRQFELKSTDSLIWWIFAQEVYRSAEILAFNALQAREKSILRSIEEFKKNSGKGSYSRMSTVEEDIESADTNQIRIAYFLLARAIELLLKAVIIEIKPDTFFDKIAYKLKMGKKGHDIFTMMKKANICLTKADEENLKLLCHYPFVGTYPIPLTADFVIEERKLQDELQKKLTHKNYEEVSNLYDLVLAKYNEIRIPKGKSQRTNYLRIKKNFTFF